MSRMPGTRLATLAVCLIFVPLTSLAQQSPKLQIPELKYETYTLPNGLKVITHEDHRLPLVAVDLWYHVGPLNERAGRTGFAHLFEHMMFEGSEHVGEKAHIKYVQGAGATDVNGTTSFDRTNYFETMPANQLELALWLESDRMGFLMEGLDRTKLANQRDVVRNERRQGEGRPYELADEQVFQLLLPQPTPTTAASSAPTPTSKPPASPTSATSTSSSTRPTTRPSPLPETSTPPSSGRSSPGTSAPYPQGPKSIPSPPPLFLPRVSPPSVAPPSQTLFSFLNFASPG